jgi:hypothetical protein
MASKKLVRLAQAAAKANANAAAKQSAWVEAFEAEYGHNDISDVLVSHIDYASGEGNHGEELSAGYVITNYSLRVQRELIEENDYVQTNISSY